MRKHRYFWGIIAPCLLGWSVEAMLVALTIWIDDLFRGVNPLWTAIPLAVAWFGFSPSVGFTMGLTNIWCCPPNLFTDDDYKMLRLTCLYVFWLPQYAILCCLVVAAFYLIPASAWGFSQGQDKGKKWLKDRTLETFLGLRNNWETHEDD